MQSGAQFTMKMRILKFATTPISNEEGKIKNEEKSGAGQPRVFQRICHRAIEDTELATVFAYDNERQT